MDSSDMFKRDCKDCVHFNPERLQDESKYHCLKWLKYSASLGCTDYELKQQNDRNDNTSENKSNEFIKAKKGFPRLACLQNGDRFHIYQVENNLCFILNGKKLYLEKVLVELDFPLLYICKSNDTRYLVLCYDPDNDLCLIAEENKKVIIQMLKKELTMYGAFLVAQKLYKVKAGDDMSSDEINEIEYSSLKPEELPKENAYYKSSDISIKKYIQKLEIED